MIKFKWINEPAKEISELHFHNALNHQARLTKPAGSLGRLEELSVRIAAMQGTSTPIPDPMHISIFAGNHGVTQLGISAYPKEVTGQMIKNFADGGAAINVMAKELNAKIEVICLGVALPVKNIGVAVHNIANISLPAETQNITKTPAMTTDQLALCLHTGKQNVHQAKLEGARLFIGGEMGIGNTTVAAAMATVLLKTDAKNLVGPGTGLNEKGVKKKIEIVNSAVKQYLSSRQDETTIEALRCLGGFEIAALTGSYISAAQCGIPVLIDGFISSVAALTACHINQSISPWLIFGHQSTEPGHQHILAALDAKPILNLDMRLGEGSGAAASALLVRLACNLHNHMATFDSAEITSKLDN